MSRKEGLGEELPVIKSTERLGWVDTLEQVRKSGKLGTSIYRSDTPIESWWRKLWKSGVAFVYEGEQGWQLRMVWQRSGRIRASWKLLSIDNT